MARDAVHPPSKRGDSRRLARPRKRHYTFARRIGINSPRSGFGTAPSQLKALICRVFLFVTKAKRQRRDRVGRGEADVFAPFVYRLGRHPFTVERAVRFR
jgi:hypothetical protein